MLRQGRIGDSNQMAKVHIMCLPNDFLPTLGEKFLTELYKRLIPMNKPFCLVEVENKNVVAFAIATKDTDKTFAYIIKNNFVTFLLLLATKVIAKPIILKDILSTFFYTSKSSNTMQSKAELLVICVSPSNQKKGIGKKIINKLNSLFKKSGVHEYIVTLYTNHKNAEKFYKKLGFSQKDKFILYKKTWNVYKKKL